MSTDEYAPCTVYLFSYVIVSIAYLCLTADFQVKPVLASSPSVYLFETRTFELWW